MSSANYSVFKTVLHRFSHNNTFVLFCITYTGLLCVPVITMKSSHSLIKQFMVPCPFTFATIRSHTHPPAHWKPWVSHLLQWPRHLNVQPNKLKNVPNLINFKKHLRWKQRKWCKRWVIVVSLVRGGNKPFSSKTQPVLYLHCIVLLFALKSQHMMSHRCVGRGTQ